MNDHDLPIDLEFDAVEFDALVLADDYVTWPRDDPHQAMLEAGLREAYGAFEIVRDPLGRIA